ncbi:MAG TPA: hypothetical protein VKS81_11620, partial [Bacteroidota bacterium]|nr:hypothetical protein [Bacteroidota bacterium]
AVAIIEALKFAGYDKEAQAGLDQIWDLQNSDGAIVGKGGEHNYKETAAAIYALIRHAELNQDWKSFIELWPDAQKASLYLAGLRTPNGGTLNDKYGLLPRGSVEDDAHGIRAEFTNTLWASIAMKRAWQTSDKLFLLKREEVKQFNVDLILALNTNMKKEERKHPDGFSYVPMYLKDDPAWSESKSKPLPQAALIYLCESLFPGLVFKGSHYSAVDTLALLKAILKDGVPAGTGSSGKDAFEPAFAAAAAQVFLWAAMPELAVTTFKSFLNHASPLYSWGEEQSLHGSTLAPVIGDMPATRAGAECIRFLRNTIVLEDDENLRILNGIVPQDLVGGKKIEASYTPTKWGRVSVSLEQSDAKSWVTKFIREGLNDAIRWPLKWVVMPRKISDSVQLLSIDGAKFYRSGDNILIDSAAMSWQAKWYNPRA